MRPPGFAAKRKALHFNAGDSPTVFAYTTGCCNLLTAELLHRRADARYQKTGLRCNPVNEWALEAIK
jgi:hypothetical protein